jgi:hypothetical protein
LSYSKKKEKKGKKGTPPWYVNVGGHPMKSVSHGLRKENRWVGVPSFIKEHQSANPSLKNLLTFCMEDSKSPLPVIDMKQPPLKINFYLCFTNEKL